MTVDSSLARAAIYGNFLDMISDLTRKIAALEFKRGRDIDAAEGLGGAEIIDAGMNVFGYLYFYNSEGTLIASLYQDGAGNLQLDLGDATKAFTINDGNVIVNHATDENGV